MAKYGNFNYNAEDKIEDILSQYKTYRKKDLKDTVSKADYDKLELSLSEYKTKEKEGIKNSFAKKVNEAQAQKLVKYTKFADDFDFNDEAAIEKAFAETNQDLFGEVKITDKSAVAKATKTKKPVGGEKPKAPESDEWDKL